ncbi:hypothetical protein ACQP0C_21385 [Nocardia sp. CA-129566]
MNPLVGFCAATAVGAATGLLSGWDAGVTVFAVVLEYFATTRRTTSE